MMRPGEIQFIDMMKLREWEYQPRTDKKTYETWEFQSHTPSYADAQPKRYSLSVDTALHFRKNGRSLIINLEKELVINYNGYPSTSATGMSAQCLSLNAFYAEIDALCGPLETPKPPTPRDPKMIWQALRATIG